MLNTLVSNQRPGDRSSGGSRGSPEMFGRCTPNPANRLERKHGRRERCGDAGHFDPHDRKARARDHPVRDAPDDSEPRPDVVLVELAGRARMAVASEVVELPGLEVEHRHLVRAVERIVAEELEAGTVKGVAAGARRQVHHTAIEAAKLRRRTVALDLEGLNGIDDWKVRDLPRFRLQHRNAIEQVLVRPRPAAVDAREQ